VDSVIAAKGIAQAPFGCYASIVRSLTIKLKPEQDAWLEEQARAVKRSKGALVRDLISRQQAAGNQASLGDQLADLCGCLSGSKDLSTRSLKGYGR
jgi:hypothetical protein